MFYYKTYKRQLTSYIRYNGNYNIVYSGFITTRLLVFFLLGSWLYLDIVTTTRVYVIE